MPTAQFKPVSAMPRAPPHGPPVGTEVAIYSGYSNNLIGIGKVVCVLRRRVVVDSSSWRMPVKFRACALLCAYRIIGGMTRYLSEQVKIPSWESE